MPERSSPYRKVRDLLNGDTDIKFTAEQKVLVALDLQSNLNLTGIHHSTDLSWAHNYNTIKKMLREGKIRLNKNGTYSLANGLKGSAKLLRCVLEKDTDITLGKPISTEKTDYSGTRSRFHEGLKTVMDMILNELPEASHGRILNIETDPCFKERPFGHDHWFYCHAISTRLQVELGSSLVQEWISNCNKKGIGEVVINDISFASSKLWGKMIRLDSHEYWLIQEPARSEGYITFADKVALISWNEQSCILYNDKRLARTFRNNIKILRLGAEIQPFCCEEHTMGGKANPDTDFYKRMWEY